MAAIDFGTRLKQGAAFVAIVWGVAASFVAFDVLALKGMDLAVAYQDLFGNLLLTAATTESRTCVVQPEERAGGTLSIQETRGAQAGAWLLGLGVGRDAVVRQFSAADSGALTQLAATVEQLADSLGVPAPGVFEPEQIANANREFVAFVEADSRGTAHQLAVGHTGLACQVYKLGAMWGYSGVVGTGSSGRARGIRRGNPLLRAAGRNSGDAVATDARPNSD